MRTLQIVAVVFVCVGLGVFSAYGFPYQTGFESPEFTIGNIHVQEGWIVPTGSSGNTVIQTSTVFQEHKRLRLNLRDNWKEVSQAVLEKSYGLKLMPLLIRRM